MDAINPHGEDLSGTSDGSIKENDKTRADGDTLEDSLKSGQLLVFALDESETPCCLDFCDAIVTVALHNAAVRLD